MNTKERNMRRNRYHGGHIREIDDEKETDGAKNKELKDGDRYEIPRSIRITQKLKSKK